uniref:Tudor domain-containing protein n=1 Tax=Pyxicephalus adspersus TaxID=30357 RepID=A0AAV2ZS71_PYXAD|nr:TPA: hypothetical protein GDO54_004115 [Pyxicephalus adspersus]
MLTNNSTKKAVQLSVSPPTSQAAPSVCDDFPNSAVSTKQQSSALTEAKGVSVAQSWVSVDLPLNEPLTACVLRVRSPDLLYVFPKENRVDVEKLHQVMMDIFSYCTGEMEPPDYTPSVGDACCAKFTDGQWYRGVVLEVSDSTVKIAYADYGNIETVPFSCLRPVKERFLWPPMQLTRCRLDGVVPPNHQWSPEGTQALSNLLLGADVVLRARSMEAGIYSVSMEKKQETGVMCVEEKLVMYGLAKHAEVIPFKGVCKENDGCCCQELKKRVQKLETMLEKLLMN